MSDKKPARIRFPRRLRQIDPARRGIVLAWLAFTITFGGVHLHHYLWGILLLAAVAIFGLVDRSPRTRSWMGIALGVALGLIVDEAALLITLEDVYWQNEGWSSIAIAVTLIGVVGSALVLTRSGATTED
ncbi:hypothetical protein CH299_08105 [Rhodococcus sp. 14-2686-1-2]|nr:hypothetical protein CH301_07555 [Rhodococcus sp. 15-1189-1-1a]OZF17083.1 hypothetical protein CH299_08105 [Rhodococcus sp. 14-2686-1-2]